jgi:hypothetical protein
MLRYSVLLCLNQQLQGCAVSQLAALCFADGCSFDLNPCRLCMSFVTHAAYVCLMFDLNHHLHLSVFDTNIYLTLTHVSPICILL